MLLNNQGLIDRKRMHCHFATARVINTFFILYTRQDIIVLLAAIPPSEYVLKQQNVVSFHNVPRGEQNKNNWLIKNRNTSNPTVAGTHSEERQSQQVRSTDGWIEEGPWGRRRHTNRGEATLCLLTRRTTDICCRDVIIMTRPKSHAIHIIRLLSSDYNL